MRYWFDTEFIEDGRTINLISIGIVAEDGRERYYENSECDHSRAVPWVRENVLPHLLGGGCRVPRARIASDLIKFVGPDPEFWAYYCAYDWVAMCQLHGTMMNLPHDWPMYCRDVKQLCDWVGNPELPKQGSTEHNALNDAIWTKEAWEFLQGPARNPPTSV